MKSINVHCHVVRFHLVPALCAIFLLAGCGGGGGGSPLLDTSPPTEPTALTATPLTSSSIALGWTASTDDSGIVYYEVFRNGSQVACCVNQTQFDDVDLLPSATYDYEVRAVDASKNTSMWVPTSAKTLDSMYRVWGVREFSVDCNYYSPDDPVACTGLDLLGAASTTTTFMGAYDHYLITAERPDHPQVDAVQFSDGTYSTVPSPTGNTQDAQNMAGAPDGNYAVIGIDCTYPDPTFGCYLGGYAVLNPTGTMSSVTIIVAP